MSVSLTSLLGAMPHYKKMAFLAWMSAAVSLRLAQVTTQAAARTAYYFSTSGNNANNGLSTGAPKQTIAAAQAIHDASSGNIELRFKRGDTWVENTSLAISKANCAVVAYDSTIPTQGYATFSQFVTGYTWAKTAGKTNVYEAAETATVFWAQEYQDVTQPYTKVTSTTLCDSTAGSWYADGAKIYVHTRDGTAPGSGTMGVCKWSNHGVQFLGSCDGGLLQGIQFLGYADTSNNWIAIRLGQIDANLVVVDNCASYFSYRHNAVTTNDTGGDAKGGMSLFNHCKFGGLLQTDGDLFVSYQDQGANECVVNDMEAVAGLLPQTGVTNAVSAIYNHTGGSQYTTGLFIVRGLRIRGGANACHASGGANNLPENNGNPMASAYYEIGTTAEPNSINCWEFAQNNGVRVNCNVSVKMPTGRAELASSPDIHNGFVLNECVSINLNTSDQVYVTLWDWGSIAQGFTHEYCAWHFYGKNATTNFCNINNDTNAALTNKMRNCVFSQDPLNPLASLIIGLNTTLDNNLYSGINANTTDHPEYGYGADAQPVLPIATPGRQDHPGAGLPYLANRTNETVPLEYDMFGRRRQIATTVGPVEPNSPLVGGQGAASNRAGGYLQWLGGN